MEDAVIIPRPRVLDRASLRQGIVGEGVLWEVRVEVRVEVKVWGGRVRSWIRCL